MPSAGSAVRKARRLEAWEWSAHTPGAPSEKHDFLLAEAADSATRIMTYTDESKSEHFAGAFSLYITDPKTFSRLRPRPYAFFAARFPDRDRPARP